MAAARFANSNSTRPTFPVALKYVDQSNWILEVVPEKERTNIHTPGHEHLQPKDIKGGGTCW